MFLLSKAQGCKLKLVSEQIISHKQDNVTRHHKNPFVNKNLAKTPRLSQTMITDESQTLLTHSSASHKNILQLLKTGFCELFCKSSDDPVACSKKLIVFQGLHSHTEFFCNHTATFNILRPKDTQNISDALYDLGRVYEA